MESLTFPTFWKYAKAGSGRNDGFGRDEYKTFSCCKGESKGSDTFFGFWSLFFLDFGSSSWAEGGLEGEFFGGFGDPVFVAERAAAMDAGLDFFGRRIIDALDTFEPVVGQPSWAAAKRDRFFAASADCQTVLNMLHSF